MWVTAFIAAYAMYRHHRVLDAILLVGAALIANMSATFTDLFGYLVLFMLAALLLWLRAALVGREEGWQRRRVNENIEVPAAIMRSGLVFIAGSLVLSWVLTSVAVAAPLTAVWNNLDTVWTGVRDNLDGVFGGLSNPDSRFNGTNFGPSFRISGKWTSSDEPVLTVAAPEGLYLRDVTYDVYNGRGWDADAGTRARVVSQQDRSSPDDTPEEPTAGDAFEIETFEVEIQQPAGRDLSRRATRSRPSRRCSWSRAATSRSWARSKATARSTPGRSYSDDGRRSAMRPRRSCGRAGTNYPPEIAQLYLGTAGVTRAHAASWRSGSSTLRERHQPVRPGRGAGATTSAATTLQVLDQGSLPTDPEPGPRRLLPLRSRTGRSASASTTPPRWW